jgi:hypothetical protein
MRSSGRGTQTTSFITARNVVAVAHRGPRDVRNGRWSEATGHAARLTLRSPTADPETLPDGRIVGDRRAAKFRVAAVAAEVWPRSAPAICASDERCRFVTD